MGVLCMVAADVAADHSFDATPQVGRVGWQLQVQVHGFLVGFCLDLVAFDREREIEEIY